MVKLNAILFIQYLQFCYINLTTTASRVDLALSIVSYV